MKASFRHLLLSWYQEHQRSLPWRQNIEPYSVWLSEIILQQTRVNQGLSYYNKFLNSFPTVLDLANASEDQVLKLWQGLGYYSRARNLHKCAKIIAQDYNGKFPNKYDQLLKLPGIGPYTAAAISSICFQEAKAVVDGNVYRVLSRYFGITTPIDSSKGKREFQALADELISKDLPGDYNQAIMEFGGMQCTPKSPNCSTCPLQDSCFALAKNKIQELPIKEKKIKQRNRYFLFQLVERQDKMAIQKRVEKDIWQNLYQLPLLECKTEKEMKAIAERQKSFSKVNKHQLSHQTIFAQLIATDELLEETSAQANIKWIHKEEFTTFAQPKLVENLWTEYSKLKKD